MTTSLSISDLSHRFGAHWVLRHINLTIPAGQSVALFGSNGSGKSTLLKIMATLLTPSHGRVDVFGNDIRHKHAEIRQRLRFLTHEQQLYPSLTVMEHMTLAGTLRGISSHDLPSLVQSLLVRMDIDHVRDRKVVELSEGMRKRLVLARLLLGDFDMVLLDEPHPTLDRAGKQILNELITEWRRAGKTLMLASHDHDVTLAHVDRLLVLDQGQWSYDGPPK